jgi:putative flippase GtrA
VPIVALGIFVLGLIVGGWPLSLAAVALLAIAMAVGYVVAALFVGRMAFRALRRPEAHPLLELLVGLVVLTVAGLVPFLGGLVGLAAVTFGVGAVALTLYRYWRGGAPQPEPATGTAGTPVPA